MAHVNGSRDMVGRDSRERCGLPPMTLCAHCQLKITERGPSGPDPFLPRDVGLPAQVSLLSAHAGNIRPLPPSMHHTVRHHG